MSDDKSELTELADKATATLFSNDGAAKVVYILYLASLVVPPVSLVGVVLAYLKRGKAAPWLQSHYYFQIRTFWIGLMIAVVGMVTSLILIGWLIVLAGVVWYVVRTVKGLIKISNDQPIPNPESWLFGD